MPTLVVFSREFLLDLSDGDDQLAEETIYFVRTRGYSAIITPTVGHSLIDMASEDQHHGAMAALNDLASGHRRISAPIIPPVENGYAELAAKEIITELAWPESKENVAYIIAEAAALAAKFVVLDDREFEDVDSAKVNEFLSGRGLPTVQIYNRIDFYGLISGQRS